MLVHLLRHFAFDRFRGFRWFSWLTGVALIWLVYVSGINGYMLPWDRLAQFVIVASFEWLDWLPTFGGTLIRNFIHPSSVNDRFFSLLSFMHIGIPLLLLLLMWVHVQRVPKAKTQPPRPIVWSLSSRCWCCRCCSRCSARAAPPTCGARRRRCSSTGSTSRCCRLQRAAAGAGLDARRRRHGVAGADALAAAAFAPRPRRRAPVRGARRRGAGTSCGCARAKPCSMRACAQGLALPYECRNGGCGVCVCSVLQGQVDLGPYQPSALTEAMRPRERR